MIELLNTDKLEGIWKEKAMARYVRGGTEESREILLSG